MIHSLMKAMLQMIDHWTKYFSYYPLLFAIFGLYCLNFAICLFMSLVFIAYHFHYDFHYHEAFS